MGHNKHVLLNLKCSQQRTIFFKFYFYVKFSHKIVFWNQNIEPFSFENVFIFWNCLLELEHKLHLSVNRCPLKKNPVSIIGREKIPRSRSKCGRKNIYVNSPSHSAEKLFPSMLWVLLKDIPTNPNIFLNKSAHFPSGCWSNLNLKPQIM